MMNIVCTIDDKFTRYCGVMLTSLFENNKGEEITIYIVTDYLSPVSIAQLDKIVVQNYKQCLHIYNVDLSLFEDFPLREGDHVSYATYYRLYLTKFLPLSVSKVLYLDADLIVRAPLNVLWEIDLSGYALAAVPDKLAYYAYLQESLGYSPMDSYFNAGVLLLNLDYLRENNFTPKALAFLKDNHDKVLYHDQDILNALFHDKWIHLHYKWNYQDFYATSYGRELFFLKDLKCETQNFPIIIHYSSSEKPWNTICNNPYRQEWFNYQNLTVWKDEKPTLSLKDKIMKLRREILFFLGLRGRSWYSKYCEL